MIRVNEFCLKFQTLSDQQVFFFLTLFIFSGSALTHSNVCHMFSRMSLYCEATKVVGDCAGGLSWRPSH